MNLDHYEVDPDPLWLIAQMSGGDGYDAMDLAIKHGWHPVPSWEPQGSDLGDWPYVIVLIRNRNGFEVAEYVEGDVTQWTFATAQLRREAIDVLFRHWRTASAG